MLILVLLFIVINGQILKKVSDCMGACHYCNLTEPTKCIANSSLITPCDQGYVFNKTVSSCVLRAPFQSNFTELQFFQQRTFSIQQKPLTSWRKGKVQQCFYKNSKGQQKYVDVIGLFTQVQSISKQFQVSQHHEIYLFSFNLIRNIWMVHDDFLIIDIESGGEKLSSYEISYQSRQNYFNKSVISCQNQTLISQKFNIKINVKTFKNNKIKITFTGFLLTSLWGLTNINFIPGCQRFTIYNKLTGGCDFCDMGYYPINQRMSLISKNQLIKCQKCSYQCNHCMNQTFCYSCIKGYKLVSFKCVPDGQFIKITLNQTINSEIKTCKVMNYSFFINSEKGLIQTIKVNHNNKKAFGNGFIVFEFVYNTKFEVNSGYLQIKVNNKKVSQITQKNLTNKGFESCSLQSLQRYSIQKFSIFVGNVSQSVNFSINLIGNCSQCKYGFAKVTFVYIEDKQSSQSLMLGNDKVITTTDRINVVSIDLNNVTTSTNTITTVTTKTILSSQVINHEIKQQQQSIITKNSSLELITKQLPTQRQQTIKTTIQQKNPMIQQKKITQKLVNQEQSSQAILKQYNKTNKQITLSVQQPIRIIKSLQKQVVLQQNNKLNNIDSIQKTTQQVKQQSQSTNIINETKTYTSSQNILQNDSKITKSSSTQNNQLIQLKQNQLADNNINIQTTNDQNTTNDKTTNIQQHSSELRVNNDDKQQQQEQLSSFNKTISTQNKQIQQSNKITQQQQQQQQSNNNQNIQNKNILSLDVLAFSRNGNNGIIIKLNKSIISYDKSNNTKLIMQLSSIANDQLESNQSEHVLYESISHQNDTSFPLLNNQQLNQQQTVFAFYTDRTYLADKVSIYCVNDNNKKELVKFFIQRTDFLNNDTQQVLSAFKALFQYFAWFIIIVLFVAILTSKMYLVLETFQLMQFTFFTVYIFTSYLPGSIVNTISGLRRLENLDFLPESFILAIQQFLLGNLVQQSPLRLTLFHKDINFIRGIIPIIILLLIITIWFLFIVFYDKKTRKQGDQHDQDGIYGDNIVENNLNFGMQNFIQWFHFQVVRKIARNKLDYWTQVLKIVYTSIIFLAFKQFNNFKYPQNHNGQIFNILFCLIVFITTLVLLIGAIVKSSKKYYKLQYENFLKSFPAIYYKKIPKNCLPTQHHLLYNPLLNITKPILFCLLVALAGNHPIPIFILMVIINVIQIIFAWMHDIYQDTLYLKFLIVQSTIFTVMLMIIMILSFISEIILTDGYLAFGYVFMAFAIVVIINGIVRSGYLIVDYVQKQMQGKEKAVESSRIV